MSAIGKVKGEKRLAALRSHRLIEYHAAYVKYLAGDCSLSYLNIRLDKLISVAPEPKSHNKKAKRWRK